MVDSQILKSKHHILLNFGFFLVLQTSICLVWLICWCPLSTPFLSFWFPVQPALSVPISCADLVCHPLSITVKTLVRCYPFSESRKQRPRSAKVVI